MQGLYYSVAMLAALAPAKTSGGSAVLQRAAQILFQVSLGAALLVTTVTYSVLVPGSTLIEHPPHRQGNISVLLSPQGHIMHALNTIFILIEMSQCRRQGFPIGIWLRDLPFGVLFCVSYLVFEWIFYSYTGFWHYPFLDYDKPFAEVSHLALVGAFVAFWYVGTWFNTDEANRKHKD